MNGTAVMEAAVNASDGSLFGFVATVLVALKVVCVEMWEAVTLDPKFTQRVVGSVLIVAAPEFRKPTL